MRFRAFAASLMMLPSIFMLALLTPATAFAVGATAPRGRDGSSSDNWAWLGPACTIVVLIVVVVTFAVLCTMAAISDAKQNKDNKR